jgi:hypothetical protein
MGEMGRVMRRNEFLSRWSEMADVRPWRRAAGDPAAGVGTDHRSGPWSAAARA